MEIGSLNLLSSSVALMKIFVSTGIAIDISGIFQNKNYFISNVVLRSLKFKKLSELQRES